MYNTSRPSRRTTRPNAPKFWNLGLRAMRMNAESHMESQKDQMNAKIKYCSNKLLFYWAWPPRLLMEFSMRKPGRKGKPFHFFHSTAQRWIVLGNHLWASSQQYSPVWLNARTDKTQHTVKGLLELEIAFATKWKHDGLQSKETLTSIGPSAW